MRMDNRPKKHTFRTCYLIYVAVLVCALIFVFVRVRSLMVQYERNAADNYIQWLLSQAEDTSSEMGEYLQQNCFADYNGESRRAELLESLKKDGLTYKAVTKGGYDSSHPVYTVYDGSDAIISVALNELSSYTKLGIMTFSEWEIDWCLVYNSESVGETEENGTASYTILMPENFTLYIDGAEAEIPSDAEKLVLSEFEYIAKFAEAPSGLRFTLSGLHCEHVFSAKNPSGQTVEAEVQNGICTFPATYGESAQATVLAESEVNALEIAKVWSKFMTNDVGGESRGLYTVRQQCRLLEGTDLYNQATSWAGSVDITFVSGHSITSWSGEKTENCILYNDNLFSCDVYLEKNLLLVTGAKRTDVFSNRMFFAKINGDWKLIDMITIE